ncbi:Non-specific phospholipase C2 [Sesamum alatum]|uniref:Non-specific phospholipase C2 n=1 Tax=Sesamum alatum TaxID=300844 RepID=A0AAE2CEZ2_9LAMI|nr:Non-specific phospholipase C2 [Sesamum alatum]
MATTTCPLTLLLFLLLLSGHPYSSSAASPIKTVVVLVMENRSFDHMLGWMKKLNPEINGVDGSESNLINTTDPKSTRVFFGSQSHFVDPDPGHSFQAIREQIFGSNDTSTIPPPMNGFAQQAKSMGSQHAQRRQMNGFDPDKCVIGGSPPCRRPRSPTACTSTPAPPTAPPPMWRRCWPKRYPQRTIFEDLRGRMEYPSEYTSQNIPATLFYRNLRKLKYVGKFHPYGLSFKKDAENGKLPGYVVVEQRYMDSKAEPANDDHPSHDVYQGQMFVKEVYETLRASPQWNETLFVITYDEHGGFYDHVATPNHGVPSPDDIVGPDPFFFKFDRLGVRVPTILISPWIPKGTVVHGPNGWPFPTSEYEHSSIPATVRKIFNLSSPPLTRREAWAGTFDGILQTLKQPRTDCPEKLPTPVKIRQGDANEDAKVSEFQQELIQLAAVLKGDDLLTSYPGKIGKNMSVREGKEYMESAVKSFFEAGFAAKKMGVDEQQIVKMRPSLSTRP